jgi:hypothetical protein
MAFGYRIVSLVHSIQRSLIQQDVTLCCGFKLRSFSSSEAMSYYSSIGVGRCPGVYA